MKSHHEVVIGDSRRLASLKNESIHLVITSPPYWQLKDYGAEQQIGFDHSYEEYINNLNLVWAECIRTLKPGCRMCINIGDQFARSVYYGRYKVIPIHSEIIRFCEAAGLDFMGSIIWQKVTTTNTTGGASIMGSFPYPRNGIVKLDFEYILLFKKPGIAPAPSAEQKELSKMTTEEWNRYFTGHWNFPGERQGKHHAMFPEELPRRLIKMFAFVGDTVLDPFLGSGTTALAAKNLGRNSVGYEVNQEFLPMIREKVLGDQHQMFGEATLDVSTQGQIGLDSSAEIAKLPFVFSDPIKFDKKVDPRLLQFGSRIDRSAAKQNEEMHSVKEVLSPELLVLGNGLRVRLLGIATVPKFASEAIAYLETSTKGQKVFLKFDATKFDENDVLFGYVYLSNKTFLNAHLIKRGLVDADRKHIYKYKEKFINKIDGDRWPKNGS
jgi:site-specific DNA-methyltransferase (adenine-specific)